ncbi:SCO family protein [Micavibrio aeruginosavorus]|uniref:SCO1/SenC family protein n=1 Tax=Micavibrio aeruginosavorus (strain ARL-13) TaxID=856793 RepID=G2KMI2_MICAA|nr:SCO family protein [Micavibrio aeruginosavorus]AEP10675.1 SCO1/SenC family protein [Micavibrio aeruginosavorus ARL-13]
MLKNRLARLALLSIAAVAIGGIIALIQIQSAHGPTPQAAVKSNGVAGADIGGPFALTDHNGQPFTEKNLAGHPTLIYFGFTFCPSICPTELQKMSAALKLADAGKAEKIMPVFITIDPDRDTVAVMKNYVAQFHPRLIGLTGTQDDINTAARAWRVYAQKVQDETMSEYTMDHSSYIYLQGPDGGLQAIFGTDSTARQIADAINANAK